MSTPQVVLTLDQLAADPAQAATLPLEAMEALLARCHVLEGVLLARLVGAHPERDGQPDARAEDRLLTVNEAALRLGLSRDYLYRHSKALPFTVRIPPRQLRFSLRGIERWVRQRQGR